MPQVIVRPQVSVRGVLGQARHVPRITIGYGRQPLRVAGRSLQIPQTIVQARMLVRRALRELGQIPGIIFCIHVVVRRQVFLVTGVTFNHAHVVKLSGKSPIAALDVVAVVTLAREMVRVKGIGQGLVTTRTFSRDVGILTALVAIVTFGFGVPTGEGIKIVVDVRTQERNGNRSKKRRSRRRDQACHLLTGLRFPQGGDLERERGHDVAADRIVF